MWEATPGFVLGPRYMRYKRRLRAPLSSVQTRTFPLHDDAWNNHQVGKMAPRRSKPKHGQLGNVYPTLSPIIIIIEVQEITLNERKLKIGGIHFPLPEIIGGRVDWTHRKLFFHLWWKGAFLKPTGPTEAISKQLVQQRRWDSCWFRNVVAFPPALKLGANSIWRNKARILSNAAIGKNYACWFGL